MTRRSIGIALALACALFAAVGANPITVRAAEDNAAEIPGTLWSGGRASGSVGGSSYDRVWRLVLTEARVALVQLRGEAGARQVADAQVALCHGNGGVLSSQVTALLGTVATV